jgi:hypothetical protein
MRALLTAAVMLGLVASAQTRKPALTAEQIIEKSIEAAGGRDVIRKLTSTVSRGIMEFEPQEIHSTIELYAKAPDRRLIVTNMEGFGEVRQGFDGKVAWSSDPARGVRELEGAELAETKREAAFNADLMWRDLFRKVELAGREKVDGREAYLIRLTPKTGKPITRYYDVESFLLIRQLNQDGAIRVDFSDYRDVGGIKVPFGIRQRMRDMQILIRITDVQNNIEIDDAIFSKPQ